MKLLENYGNNSHLRFVRLLQLKILKILDFRSNLFDFFWRGVEFFISCLEPRLYKYLFYISWSPCQFVLLYLYLINPVSLFSSSFGTTMLWPIPLCSYECKTSLDLGHAISYDFLIWSHLILSFYFHHFWIV